MKNFRPALVGLALLSLAPVAAAQEAAGPGLLVSEQDIVVTARRRSESIDQVPIAVTAISSGAIAELPVRDLQDLQRYVPSLQTSQVSRDDTILTIRGQGPGVGAFPGVLTYFNEIPFRGLGEAFYYDLENVQVLKGPQGTLFGRNSNGGAILFSSAAPAADLGGYVQTGLGSFGNRELQGALNIPVLGNQLIMRVAGTIGSREGFTRNLSGARLDARDYGAGRVSLRWQTGGVRNDIVADYSRIDTAGSSAILTAINPKGPFALLSPQLLGAASVLLAQQRALGPRTQVGTSTDPVRQVKHWGILHRLELQLTPDLTLANIAAYRRYQLLFRADYDGTTLPLLDYSITPDGYIVNEEQLTEELQLQGRAGKLRYTLGAYGQHNRPVGEQQQIGVIFFQPTRQVNDADDLSRAVYGQLEFDAGPMLSGLQLSAGGRYTWDRRIQRAATANLLTGACSGAGATPPTCILEDTVRFEAPNWSVTAAWTAGPRTLIYLTSRHGYKGGGLNLGQPVVSARSYQPEYVTDVELGVKTSVTLGAAMLRVSADAYRGRYSNVQVNALVADTSVNAVYNVVENGASATVQGVEFEATLALPQGLRLDLGYVYNNAHYNRYLSSIYGDLSGAPWPYTSRHRASLAASLALPAARRFGQLVLGAHLSVQSNSTFGYDPDPTTHEPGYALLDLSFDVGGVLGSAVDATVFVTNVTDRLYRTGVIGLYNTVGFSSSVYGTPRVLGLRFRIAR